MPSGRGAQGAPKPFPTLCVMTHQRVTESADPTRRNGIHCTVWDVDEAGTNSFDFHLACLMSLSPRGGGLRSHGGEMHLLWLESKKLEKHHGTDSPKVVSSNSSPERWVRRSFYHSLHVSHTPTCIADRFHMRKNTEHNRTKLRLGLEKTQREGGLHQLCELTFFVVFPKLA